MPINNPKTSVYVILGIDPQSSQVIDYYVGSSQNVQRRFTEHKSELKREKHKNPRLQEFWNNVVKTLGLSTPLDKAKMDTLFPHMSEYSLHTSTAWLVFIPIIEFPTPSGSKGNKEMKAELEECEKAVADALNDSLGFTGTNYWLYTGTPDRDSRPVCINGQVYKSRSVAAQALGFMKNGKPDKQKVWGQIAQKGYPKHCFIDGSLLTKKVEIRNSRGKLLSYELWECGTAQQQANGSYMITYYQSPKVVGTRPVGGTSP